MGVAIIAGVFFFAVFVLLVLWKGSQIKSDINQPINISCPRVDCGREVGMSDIVCINCGSIGTVKREVIRQAGVANSFFNCSNCGSASVRIDCPSCGTNIRGKFEAKDSFFESYSSPKQSTLQKVSPTKFILSDIARDAFNKPWSMLFTLLCLFLLGNLLDSCYEKHKINVSRLKQDSEYAELAIKSASKDVDLKLQELFREEAFTVTLDKLRKGSTQFEIAKYKDPIEQKAGGYSENPPYFYRESSISVSGEDLNRKEIRLPLHLQYAASNQDGVPEAIRSYFVKEFANSITENAIIFKLTIDAILGGLGGYMNDIEDTSRDPNFSKRVKYYQKTMPIFQYQGWVVCKDTLCKARFVTTQNKDGRFSLVLSPAEEARRLEEEKLAKKNEFQSQFFVKGMKPSAQKDNTTPANIKEK